MKYNLKLYQTIYNVCHLFYCRVLCHSQIEYCGLEFTHFTQENANYPLVMLINYNNYCTRSPHKSNDSTKHLLDGDKWNIWWILP